MTSGDHRQEGAEEEVEDLDAPAEAVNDIAGGAGCGRPSVNCLGATCTPKTTYSAFDDPLATHNIVVWEQ